MTGRVIVGMKVTVEHDAYGMIGVAECTGVFECHVYELKDTVMALADGDTVSKGLLYKEGCNDLTKVQCARFRFIRRSDVAVTKLLDGELPKIGVEVMRQGMLSL